jgi:hypothetical protein
MLRPMVRIGQSANWLVSGLTVGDFAILLSHYLREFRQLARQLAYWPIQTIGYNIYNF